jgi:hypothetical protein
MDPARHVSMVAAVVNVSCALFFLLLAPTFAARYADLGHLPALTALALEPATSIAAALFLAGGTAAGVLRPRERAVILGLTAGGGITLVIGFGVAMWAPLFRLAESIE